jgi:hypothetical protein
MSEKSRNILEMFQSIWWFMSKKPEITVISD